MASIVGKEPAPTPLRITTELVEVDIPFLLSQESSKLMQAVVDFTCDALKIVNKFIAPLVRTPRGHISFRWIPRDNCVVRCPGAVRKTLTLYPVSESLELGPVQIMKLHTQFGHCDVSTLVRICKLAEKRVQENEIKRVVQSCTRSRSSGHGEKPVVSRYISRYPGEIDAIDGFRPHPENPQKHPAVLAVCMFSRFVCSRFISNSTPEQFLDVLLTGWVPLFGYPRIVLCDSARSFMGPSWNAATNNFDIELVMTPYTCIISVRVSRASCFYYETRI